MSKDRDKVAVLPGGCIDSAQQLRSSIKALSEAMPFIQEYERLRASQTRTRYLALLQEGFSKEEALSLCKDIAGVAK